MNYKTLKWTRVGIALVFFIFTSLVFLDFRDLFNEKIVNQILFLQFIPSLLKFITLVGLSAAGFVVILVLTALFGRIYCSAICPLGILQDFISRVGMYFKKKKRYKYRKPNTILRNVVLLITLLSGIFFTIMLVNLIDPYSMYGKVANGLFRPVGIWINNGIASILESMDVFFLYLKDQHPVHLATLAFPVLILITLLIMAGRWGRLYCNTICPVGTALGWISRYSLIKINLNKDNCTQCGKCAFACKAQCISVKNMEVDHSRCVSCYNCLPVCEDSAINYGLKRPELKVDPPITQPDPTGRKNFFIRTLTGSLAILGIKSLSRINAQSGDPININPTTIPEEKNYPVSPPGSLSLRHFTRVCTACQLCVSQCPTGVLQPSFTQFGLEGYMQPHMDYYANYCNYECVRCGDVCPTGAILPLRDDNKQTLQIGKVIFIKENCVVYTENTACGSCSEHCPTQAVKMVPYQGSLTIPETDNSICVGCGACEYACPVVPYKAIYVDGNPIHQTAEKPVSEKLEAPSTDEDFPF
jgi:ferredoxin